MAETKQCRKTRENNDSNNNNRHGSSTKVYQRWWRMLPLPPVVIPIECQKESSRSGSKVMVCLWVCVCAHMCVCMCMSVHISVWVCVCVCLHARLFTQWSSCWACSSMSLSRSWWRRVGSASLLIMICTLCSITACNVTPLIYMDIGP